MNVPALIFLLIAGVGAGLTGSVAGLASLVSYPALLAVGLPPISANVTNTLALLGTTVGAAAGSRPELAGQRGQLKRLCLITGIGGACGAALLLLTPAGAFTAIVPFLIAGASILMLLGPRLRRFSANSAVSGLGPLTAVAAFCVAVYGGYFGAAAGVLMLALLSTVWAQSLARSNAAKNIATGAANLIAAVVFAFTGKVNWPAMIALCAGSVIGSWIGPAIVRRVPATPLRIVIALAGLGLAGTLGWQAFVS
ncbi:sulfite exporter TauE/SafE family protein [Amycolatopsis sp. K13G38]|uniref:Probable membrane transporter protein n=1 Tax=Amycolatopsis acididurans TaxID=2724524 RepID=A0ABX1J2H5_9PSEU|nr:sulfite exporter TauE/SafE family protein [Amycolatopsis acididurans]NKQ53576.1 sulfite exporter TauE/SafE family protein [Amycolatopsis acididurans]